MKTDSTVETNATEPQPPFTVEQLRRLTQDQRAAVDGVIEYLNSTRLKADAMTDEQLSEVLNLLKPCRGCVPVEEIDEGLASPIRKKFAAVYRTALEMAAKDLKARGLEEFSFSLVIQPSWNDLTLVVVVDREKPVCYLHEGAKAWHFHFETLVTLAEEVLRVRRHLVRQVETLAP